MISNHSIEAMLSRPLEKRASHEQASSVNGPAAHVLPTLGEATKALLAELGPDDRGQVCTALAWLDAALGGHP
jgi:hypothetical protein